MVKKVLTIGIIERHEIYYANSKLQVQSLVVYVFSSTRTFKYSKMEWRVVDYCWTIYTNLSKEAKEHFDQNKRNKKIDDNLHNIRKFLTYFGIPWISQRKYKKQFPDYPAEAFPYLGRLFYSKWWWDTYNINTAKTPNEISYPQRTLNPTRISSKNSMY